MKKYYTLLLIISIICMIASVVLLRYSPLKNTQSKSTKVLNEIRSEEEISDPEGYTYLIRTIGATTYDLGSNIANGIFILLIPGFLLLIVVICQITARLFQIGEEKKWKKVTSNVFIYIAMAFQILLCLNLIFDLLGVFDVNKVILAITLLLNIASIIAYIITIVKINKFKTING